MSDCVNETPDCVEKSSICLRIIFDLKNSHTLEKIMGRIKHFSNFWDFFQTLKLKILVICTVLDNTCYLKIFSKTKRLAELRK